MALTPSRNPSSFKDPRETGEAANQRLSSYFEGKAENKPAFSYSTGGGEAPASGGTAPAPAPSGPKAPTATGGSGFVNFGQYFGANAPAVQAQAQRAVTSAQGAGPKPANVPAAAPGLSTFGTVQFGKTPSASTMAQRQQMDPLSRNLAQTQRQSANLQTIADTGDLGKGATAFDQMLGGGVAQQTARQEQQRLGTLSRYYQGEQGRLAQEAASRQAQEEAQFDLDRQREEAEFYRRAEEERRYYEDMRRQQEGYAADQEGSFQYEAPEEYDDLGEGGY